MLNDGNLIRVLLIIYYCNKLEVRNIESRKCVTSTNTSVVSKIEFGRT